MTPNPSRSPISSLARRFALGLAAVLALASCGGETQQIEPFVAKRYFAFGDEMSAFTADGRKYSINGLNVETDAIDCTQSRIWIQYVAAIYKFGFAECPEGTGEQKAVSRAAPGAKAADLVLQINAQVAAGGFEDRDLATVLIGTNDIKEIYESYGGGSTDAVVAEARRRGVRIGEQINRLVELGAKVIVSTTPDLGTTPYGLAQGSDGAKLLTRLSNELNGRVRVTFLNDGRFVGLVSGDEWITAAVRFPDDYGLDNVSGAACNVALPDCTSETLVTGATADTWLWADDLWVASRAQRGLGQLAESRARDNPF